MRMLYLILNGKLSLKNDGKMELFFIKFWQGNLPVESNPKCVSFIILRDGRNKASGM